MGSVKLQRLVTLIVVGGGIAVVMWFTNAGASPATQQQEINSVGELYLIVRGS